MDKQAFEAKEKILFSSAGEIAPGAVERIVRCTEEPSLDAFVVDVDPEIAPAFDILDFQRARAAKRDGETLYPRSSYLASGIGIAAEVAVFTKSHAWSAHPYTRLLHEEAEACHVAVVVKNVSSSPVRFRAAVTGGFERGKSDAAREDRGICDIVPLGFEATAIEPGKTSHVYSRTHIVFRGDYLTIVDPDDFVVESILVGNRIMEGKKLVRGETKLIGPNVRLIPINMDVAKVAQEIEVRIRNVSETTKAPRFAIWGPGGS